MNESHISIHDSNVVLCSLYMYLVIVYSLSNCVLEKNIECSDYFGKNRQVYETTGNPTDLVIVNDVAYYIQISPEM